MNTTLFYSSITQLENILEEYLEYPFNDPFWHEMQMGRIQEQIGIRRICPE